MKKAQIKKSVSALAMAAVIAVSLFGYGCGAKSASTSSDAGVSGDFTGTAKGFGGDVSVTLTLTDGAITGCTAEGKDETQASALRPSPRCPARSPRAAASLWTACPALPSPLPPSRRLLQLL